MIFQQRHGSGEILAISNEELGVGEGGGGILKRLPERRNSDSLVIMRGR